MKVLVTGGGGRLGRALARCRGDEEIVALDRVALDVCDPDAIARALDVHAPTVVVNTAAFTAVDRAEHERDRAFAVNARGAGDVACACAARGVALVHVSTDHVFAGTATRPYREDDPVAPRSVYAASKAAGEDAVRAAGGRVVRTSWLFGEDGVGFVPAIAARLRVGEAVRVVADQRGCPTWVDDLAGAILALVRLRDAPDVVHYAGDEPTTWHGLAVAIAELLGVDPSQVAAIGSDAWGAAAPRPAYAVLDTERARRLGLAPRSWRPGLRHVLSAGARG